MKVLVADDNHANCLIAQILLERAGHTVVIVTNGLQALETAKIEAYDLIILDLKMPIMSGVRALRKIREEAPANRNTLIFALTAYCSPKDKRHYLSVGFDAVMTKPLRDGNLEDTLQSIGPNSDALFQNANACEKSNLTALLDEKKLRRILDQQCLRGLFEMQSRLWASIRTQCQNIYECLPTAIEADGASLSEFRRAVHAIMVTSASIGMTRIEHICRQLRNAPRPEISHLMQSFVEAIHDSRTALDHALSEYVLSRPRQLNTAVKMGREDKAEASHHSQNNRTAIRY